MASSLTFEDEIFCREMVMSGDILVSYRTAWAAARSLSDSAVYKKASQKLKGAAISTRIAELRSAVAKTLVADKARVLEEIAGIAFLDPLDVIDDVGTPLPMSKIPRRARAAIKSIEFRSEQIQEFDEDGSRAVKFVSVPSKIEFWPKSTALDQLSKHLGLYAADNSQKHQKPSWETLPNDVRLMMLTELKKVAQIASDSTGPGVDSESAQGTGQGTSH